MQDVWEVNKNKFLLVHRHAHKPDGNTWGLPSGKVNRGETDTEAMLRELFEETGYKATEPEMQLLGSFDFISPRGDSVTYVTYQIKLSSPHEVVLEKSAHSEYKWATINEANARNDLIHGLHDLFRLVGFLK